MRHRAILLTVLMVLATTAASAQTAAQAPDSQIYRLIDGSSYSTGCSGPCLCIVQITTAVTGTFRLTKTGQDPLFTYYTISDLSLLALRGSTGVSITGSGTYKIGGEVALVQQMTLALSIDGGDVQKLDSGVVSVAARFPAFTISASTDPMSCLFTGVTFAAEPVAPVQVVPYSVATSNYEEGCFGPCDCPVRMRPVFGRFGLVKLADLNGLTTFGVVDVNWRIASPTPTSTALGGVAVRGSGLYQTGGSATASGGSASTQRMLLNLSFDGAAPQKFDSGQVAGGGNPFRIDIDLAANGFACLDQVFDLHARRIRTLATMQAQPTDKKNGRADKKTIVLEPQ